MKASQLQNLNNHLWLKRPRDSALDDVRQLFKLLPKGSGDVDREIDYAKAPPEVTEMNTSCPHLRRRDALLSSFLKKFKGFTFGDPRAAAVEKFLFYEKRCEESNSKIRALRTGGNPFLQSVLFTAQRKIANVLGDFKFDELLSVSRWGPGSTSSCTGLSVSSPVKFQARPDVTKEFLSYAGELLPLLPSWSSLLADTDYGSLVNPVYHYVKGNKITFVPKTSKIHRAIAIEPHINVFFQNGIGRMIRKRMLRYAKVDLNDQTLNQRLAKLGSIDNSLATLDLEGASDTICRELVRDLLPEDWFRVLDSARSHVGKLDGEEIRYQKFSSMGNGATFDLESLIFWGIASAVVELEGFNSFWVNVFGDDIVVPSGVANKVVEALEGVGFIVNKSKSFLDGPFRESCGFDYLSGYNVRAIYLKDIPTKNMDWIVLANQFRRLSHDWGERLYCDSSLFRAYKFCLSRIDERFRGYHVPLGYDLKKSLLGGYEGCGLLVNFDEALDHKRARNGWDGWEVRGLSVRTDTNFSNSRSLLVSGTHIISERGNELPLRGKYEYREGAVFIPFSWYNLGPWRSSKSVTSG